MSTSYRFALRCLGISFFTLTASGAALAATGPVDLNQAFRAAWENTEARALRGTVEEQASERVSQAKGSILPTIDFTATYLRQDEGSSGIASVSRPDQSTVKVTAAQPIFRGLREFAALRGTEARESAEHANTDNAKTALFVQVAQVYYSVLSSASDVDSLQNVVALTQKQEGDLLHRLQIGRSREGDLLATRTQLASAQAQLEASRSSLQQSREQFAFLTGYSRDVLLTAATIPRAGEMATLDSYLQALRERPDLRSLELQADAANEDVSVAKGAHLPTVDALADYYFKRTGSLEGSKWDVGLTFTLPLFQGGVIQSQVRAAAAVSKQADLTLVRARRDAERSIRSTYELLQGQLSQIGYLKKGLDSAQANYRAQVRDYGLGLVTNLDVLAALKSLDDARRQFNETEFQAAASQSALEAAVGRYPALATDAQK